MKPVVKKMLEDLDVEDLVRGYREEEDGKVLTCAFCGEFFEEGYVYPDGTRFMTARTAVMRHVEKAHGGSFQAIMAMEKDTSGISDSQKRVMEGLFEGAKSQAIAQAAGIAPSTVRAHKFNLNKMQRQAKIFLAAMKLIESSRDRDDLNLNSEKQKQRSKQSKNTLHDAGGKADDIKLKEERSRLFSLNSLYPFFNQNRIK